MSAKPTWCSGTEPSTSSQDRSHVPSPSSLAISSGPRPRSEPASAASSNLCPVHGRSATSGWTWKQRRGARPMTDEQRHATSGRERAAWAKECELVLHRAAIQLHEQVAEAQQRLGCDDRAQAARQRADHARSLYELAIKEQAAQVKRWEPHDRRANS